MELGQESGRGGRVRIQGDELEASGTSDRSLGALGPASKCATAISCDTRSASQATSPHPDGEKTVS